MDSHITIVSGLPRSGTSMMMRMLELGGMKVVTDRLRKADRDNPLGYYELEVAKKIRERSDWLCETQGKVFKMISMLLQHLPSDYQFKIVFMQRDSDEILASQAKMVQRLRTKGPDLSNAELANLYKRHLAATESWLTKQKNIDVHYANYNGILDDPRRAVIRVAKFLGQPLRIGEMIAGVDDSLYRNRAAQKEEKLSIVNPAP